MDSLSRKRNVSDGDSGFDSALSSRSSSISLEESPEYGRLFDQEEELESKFYYPCLKEKFASILTADEDISNQNEFENLFIITNKVTGYETFYKPPSRLKFSCTPPQVALTFSMEEYDRSNQIPRSHLFHSRLEYELEKQIAKMSLVEVDLVMNSSLSPPPSLGIRVIGVNMIHGVQDKLNIYVKRVVEDSVAGLDGRIMVNDHIIEVNGISLVGVSQKLAAQTLSNCAICPETGTVHFVLGRPKSQEDLIVEEEKVEHVEENKCDSKAVQEQVEEKNENDVKEVTKLAENLSGDTKIFTKPENAFPGNGDSEFEGRHAIRLKSGAALHSDIGYAKELLRFSKKYVLIGSVLLVAAYLAAEPKKK
eukprot:GFUD01022808.1.p1 GENE.GFUD01022808.1~~GFUD01022808.1.p1  ORF type:complete len:365 (-),score=103.62 GFUD01022808.1:680-1774(-)